ncbi:MAG: helix-turn-helix transcriptional regulator [Bryobacteraceae bacterium]|nr:helix-turn-helix transcriptional regulator [Bryobacteraceae bacterium]
MTFGLTENSEATIRRVLSSYEVGRKLRQLRLRKKIGLVDLGRHTGLSASMLSQLENGKLLPTLPTLARIAMVFDVGLDHFFGAQRKAAMFSVVRGAERMRFAERADAAAPAYYFECLSFSAQNKGLQAYLAEFPKREAKEVSPHIHDGAEFVHVLEGSIAIDFDGEERVLRAGDSAYFDGSEPHSYRGLTSTPARALVVSTPPRL